MNDLPQSLTCECSIFADDSTAYTAEKDAQLTCHKLSLNLDYHRHNMPLIGPRHGACYSALRRVNISKLPPKTQNLNQSDVFMHGSYIPRVTTHKHLGVHINSGLSWQDHIDHVYTDCARKIGILRRLQRKIRSTALRKIFIGAIRPYSSSMPAPCGAEEIPQVGQTSRTVLPLAPDCLTSIATAI